MTQAEIWDDSALVDSWNAALDEYKRYHSIHARGENVQEVLRKFQEEEDAKNEPSTILGNESQAVPEALYDEDNVSMTNPVIETTEARQDVQSVEEGAKKPNPQAATSTSNRPSPGPPPQLLGSVKDEGLKNLLMSWYYAGYYTGLYEGQQHGQKDTDK